MEPVQEIEEDWGQWIEGGANAAPAANAGAIEPALVPDLNIPMEDFQPMELDLNEIPNQDMDEGNNVMDLQQANQGQISLQHSAARLDLFSESSVGNQSHEDGANSENLHQYNQNVEADNEDEIVLWLPTHPALKLANDAARLLPNDLLLALNDNSAPQQVNLNLQVGFMRFQDPRIVDPVFERFTMQVGPKPMPQAKNVDLYRIWGRFFSPVGDPTR
jgi:hypothetical protein